jgi:cbb3-type cytochrome oxidase cytochrome c subunit
MVQSFDLLSREEQFEWIATAKAALHDKLAELEAYTEQVTVPYQDQVHDNAVSSVQARIQWLDRLLFRIAGTGANRSEDAIRH